jgi:glutathione S-transferase
MALRAVEHQVGELSVADLKRYVALRAFPAGVYDHVSTDILDSWPRLTALVAAVEADPRVAAWNAGRS